jgi:hypothetical protein
MRLQCVRATVGLAALSLAATTPSACADGISEQCILSFVHAVGARDVGARCRWLNRGNMAMLNRATRTARECIISGATPEETKGLIRSEISTEVADIRRSIRKMPCDDAAHRYFNEQVGTK